MQQAGGGMRRAATERAIIHLDMDCFFAAVAELTDPALKGQPLAVSHSASAQGTGEVSSANYEARKAGIRAGMFIGEAKRRCPHLVVMPYTFDKFEEISEQVGCLCLCLYSSLHRMYPFWHWLVSEV